MADSRVTQIEAHEHYVLVTICVGSMNESATNTMVDDVQTAAVRYPAVPIVLDLSRVRFAPSSAVGAILALSKGFKLDRRRLAIVGARRHVLDVIRVTGVDRVLEVRDRVDQLSDIPPVKK